MERLKLPPKSLENLIRGQKAGSDERYWVMGLDVAFGEAGGGTEEVRAGGAEKK